jgi:hypothetical protein
LVSIFKLEYDGPFSEFAFKFNLRRYPVVYGDAERALSDAAAGSAGAAGEAPRLTAAALMRVVEWKVAEHQSKEAMKRAGAALQQSASRARGGGAAGGGAGGLDSAPAKR